jgi:hypothetical protein
MKKITLLLMMLFIGFTSHAQFDWSASPLDNGWVEYAGSNGAGATNSWTYYEGENPYMAIGYELGGLSGSCEDWLVSPLIGITSVSSGLSFTAEDGYADEYGSSLSIQVSTTDQASGFSEVDVFPEMNGNATLSVDLSTYEGSDVYIAFVWINNDGDNLYLWDLALENLNANAPNACINMVPADESTVDLILGANGTSSAINFSWDPATTGDLATSYEIFVGTNSDGAPWIGSLLFTGGALGFGGIPDTTYYWQIRSINAGGNTLSAIQSFTTSSVDPLGIEDFTFDALSVSPNPVKDVITINSPVGFDSVEVFNQLGQLVLKSNADLMNNNKLDLSALNPGMYMLQIKADNKSKTVKIIKE